MTRVFMFLVLIVICGAVIGEVRLKLIDATVQKHEQINEATHKKTLDEARELWQNYRAEQARQDREIGELRVRILVLEKSRATTQRSK